MLSIRMWHPLPLKKMHIMNIRLAYEHDACNLSSVKKMKKKSGF